MFLRPEGPGMMSQRYCLGPFYKKKGSWFKPIDVQMNECLCNLAQLGGCQWLVFLVGSAVVLPKNNNVINV